MKIREEVGCQSLLSLIRTLDSILCEMGRHLRVSGREMTRLNFYSKKIIRGKKKRPFNVVLKVHWEDRN